MKKLFSKVLISGLALFLMLGTALPAFATDTVAGFDDVKQGSWYYDSVMAMAQKGYISGTKAPDANGIGEYSPDSTMTRGQFVAIVVRIMYKSELDAMGDSGSEWWRNAYNLAVSKGLLNPSELNQGDMEKPMSREEMALVLARASTQRSETPSQLIKSAAIPDYSKVSFAYRDSVIQVYSMGLLAGVDNNGTFSPEGTLTRAQAAAVIYRLIEPSTRVQVDFNKAPQTTNPTNPGQTTTGTQTWTEGQAHGQPKEGDVVVKADGTQVVIKRGLGGVLGAGQGINIWAGYYSCE